MKPCFGALCLAGLIMVDAGCNQPDNRTADAQAIKDLEAAWQKDTKDVEKVLSYYADDASLVILGEPVATGKDAIRKVIKNMVSDPNFTLMFGSNCIEVSKGGTSATAWEPTSCLRLTPLTSQPKRKNRPRVGAS